MRIGSNGLVALVACGLFAVEAPGGAIVFSESFDNDTAGWTSCCNGPGGPEHVSSGGFDGGGFLKVTRVTAGADPFTRSGAISSPSLGTPGFGGDLTAIYDPAEPVTITIHHKNVSENPPDEGRQFGIIFGDLRFPGIRGQWRKEIPDGEGGVGPVVADSWTKHTEVIDLKWTDQEATAAGWCGCGANPPSWQLQVSDPNNTLRLGGWANSGSKSLNEEPNNVNMNNAIGFDEISFSQGEITIPGDFDGNGVVDADDIDLLCDELGGTSSDFDLNGDSMVNQLDGDHLIEVILGTEYGDADLMGGATLGDLGTLAGNFTSTRTDFGWADGDFNWDGEVTLADLGILAANFGPNGPIPQAEFEAAVEAAFGVPLADVVPEPATAGMIVLCALGLLRRRR